MKRLGVGILLIVLSACQSLPPREEMLDTACNDTPCRSARVIQLQDATGKTHRFEIPAGPVFAGGVLSIVQGEQQYLAVKIDDQDRARLRWMPPQEAENAQLAFRLQQVTEDGQPVTRLSVFNRLDQAIWIDAEQFPVNADRFHPLALSPIPPSSRVHKEWTHTILEVQITGLRPL